MGESQNGLCGGVREVWVASVGSSNPFSSNCHRSTRAMTVSGYWAETVHQSHPNHHLNLRRVMINPNSSTRPAPGMNLRRSEIACGLASDSIVEPVDVFDLTKRTFS
jgi:hypothetical protein